MPYLRLSLNWVKVSLLDHVSVFGSSRIKKNNKILMHFSNFFKFWWQDPFSLVSYTRFAKFTW